MIIRTQQWEIDLGIVQLQDMFDRPLTKQEKEIAEGYLWKGFSVEKVREFLIYD